MKIVRKKNQNWVKIVLILNIIEDEKWCFYLYLLFLSLDRSVARFLLSNFLEEFYIKISALASIIFLAQREGNCDTLKKKSVTDANLGQIALNGDKNI